MILSLLTAIMAFSMMEFESGEEFTVRKHKGEVRLTCVDNGSYSTVTFRCNQFRMESGSYDRVIGPMGDYKKLKLKSFRADGKKVKKKVKYDGSTGESGRVNLWISTLFQKPLLSLGENRIEYTLSGKAGTLTGEMMANVTEAESRTCEKLWIRSHTMHDCRTPGNACYKYYSRRPRCR